MNKKEIRKKDNLCAIAEMYNQNSDYEMFKKFSTGAMEGVKNLAKAVQKARDVGLIK